MSFGSFRKLAMALGLVLAVTLVSAPCTGYAAVELNSGPPERPRLYVLALGINDYQNSRVRLAFAEADAKAISDAFKRAGESLYESIEAIPVLGAEVNTANLNRIFSDLGQKVRPQDVFVFFASGAGKTVDGRFYLIPQDFQYDGEESIVKEAIGQDQLETWFSRIPAQRSALLFDANESGSILGDRVLGLEDVAAVNQTTRAVARTIIAATTSEGAAAEGYRGHGLFTYAVLKALGDAQTGVDGLIHAYELASYVDRAVPQLGYDAWRVRQVPQIKIVGQNFALVSKLDVLSEDRR
jgi:uncharacterized caspase-like protein